MSTESSEAAAGTSTNRLAGANSPYLLQHADNPVDWYPWGPEAFEKARREDRPVFLSIGYSTCHWCHVMAHESFEDPEVAELLNRHFVSIKVDREERPDVDAVYMTACQMMTGRGGWPLTIFMTPDRKPFFAGTYFPKQGRGGRPGLMQILRRVAELWEDRRDELLDSAEDATSTLRRIARTEPGPELGEAVVRRAYEQLDRTYDPVRGGFGNAPKFPTPQNLLFLLRHAHRTGESRPLEMVTTTLRAMRRGGIYDHVGYGFHRYSTDARWLVPHFEKMLYDQALLALAYVETYQVTGEAFFARTAREVFRYARRDLRDPGGAFHAAEDADSEGGEGAFYVWTLEQLKETLSPESFELVRGAYNVRSRGNYSEEATGEPTGHNILHLQEPVEELARQRGISEEELRSRLETAREELHAVRERRPRPHRDDKVLTDWNGLMIAALARGGFVLDDPDLVTAAREAATFLLDRLRDEDGRLLHRWREGEAAVRAHAADYAFLTWGLVELYEATFEARWLEAALRTADEAVEHCWDRERGGFFTAADDVEDLPVRQKEVHDGAVPSANSVALWNERRLARLTGRTEREERALEIERAFSEPVRESPAAHTMFMVGLDFRIGETHELVLAADPEAAASAPTLDVLRERFLPRTVTLVRPPDAAGSLGDLAPFVRDLDARDGAPTAYLCTDFTCREPITDPAELAEALSSSAG